MRTPTDTTLPQPASGSAPRDRQSLAASPDGARHPTAFCYESSEPHAVAAQRREQGSRRPCLGSRQSGRDAECSGQGLRHRRPTAGCDAVRSPWICSTTSAVPPVASRIASAHSLTEKAHQLPGYQLVAVAVGKDVITGGPVPQDAEHVVSAVASEDSRRRRKAGPAQADGRHRKGRHLAPNPSCPRPGSPGQDYVMEHLAAASGTRYTPPTC